MNRSISADLIKTASIFGVVFIHGSFLLGSNSNFQSYLASLFRFCVPCFIILWAYFFEKSYVKKNITERKEYITKRFLHLLILFTIWSLLYFFYLVNWETLSVSKLITAHFSGYGWSGQYFFIILFQLVLLYPILRLLYNRTIIRISLLVLLLITYVVWGYCYDSLPEVLNKIGDRPFIFWIPYVFFGIALSREQIRIPLIGILFVFLIPIEYYFFKYSSLTHPDYITPGILLGSILFCGAILQYKSITIEGRFQNIITFIGNNTMTIFVANPIVILILKRFIPKNIWLITTPFEKVIAPLLSTCIIISICLLIDFLIKKYKLNGYLN